MNVDSALTKLRLRSGFGFRRGFAARSRAGALPPAIRVALLTGSNGFRMASQFAVLPILARLLSPADYGTVGIVSPIILFALIIAECGLSSALTRVRQHAAEAEATIFWFSCAVGLALTATMAASAPLFAYMLTVPKAAPVLALLAPIMLLSALCTVPTARVQREDRTWVFALSDIASAAISAAVAIVLALQHWGPYALVAQQLTMWGIKAGILLVFAPPRVAMIFHWARLRDAMRFGMPLMGAILVDFISRLIDNLAIGRFLGVTSLGFYALAYQIMRVPDAVLSGPIAVTVFPIASRIANEPGRSTRLFGFLVQFILTFAAPLLLGLALVADIVVPWFLGARWGLSGDILQILAPAGVAQCLVPVCNAILMGVDHTRTQLRLTLATVGLVLVGIVFGIPYGLTGVALGVAVATALGGVNTVAVTAHIVGFPLKAMLARAAAPVGASLLMVAVVLAVRHALADQSALVRFVAIAVTGGGAYLLASYGAIRGLIAEFKDMRLTG